MSEEVFILGAGFSKWLHNPMPLMSDLADAVRNDPDAARRLKELELGSILGQTGDFERLISYLHNPYPWKSNEEALREKALYHRCVDVALKGLREKQAQVDWDSVPNSVSALFNYWSEKRSTVVTFNYDTLVEQGLAKLCDRAEMFSLWKQPIAPINIRADKLSGGAFMMGSYEKGLPFERPNDFPSVIKLHGSLNWWHSGDFATINDQVYYVHPLQKMDNSEPKTRIHSKGLRPLIVPPSLEKSSFFGQPLIRAI